MSKVKVLNVNDREVTRYVNEQMLLRGGFDVVSVATGQAALAAAADSAIEVVLLDVQLPDVDGFEVCNRLRQNAKTANLIILMTSATFVTAKNKVVGLDAGADGYLVQPYEAAELYATMRSLLRARAAERRASALAVELQSAMEVRDEFLAMLGHELRNPLSAITTALHVMDEVKDPTAQARYRAILARQSKNLTRIVDDLLDVARITRGKISLERQRVDLRDIAKRCVAALEEDIAKSGHVLAIDFDDAPVVVVGDAVRLEQIASNLLTNAIKYTPKGGHLAISVKREGSLARLVVSDDGIGMAPAIRDRAFDTFVQAKQTIDRSRGGLGLGLTVVRQLVELQGGKVAAESDGEGQGSRFVVELPLELDGGVASAPRALGGAAPSGLRIVIIEDNDDARATLEDALHVLEHQVESAGDGTSGLALVLASKPDVVLMDIGLPGIDGYEVARQIRKQMDGTSPRLVAITGYGMPEDRARAAEAGFDLHLAKPVSIDKIKQALATVAQ